MGKFSGEEPLGELWKTQKTLLGTLDKLTGYGHEGQTGSHTGIRRYEAKRVNDITT